MARDRDMPERRVPDLLVSGATAVVLLLCLYSVLCIIAPASLQVPADPATVPAVSKPDWPFLFLYKYAQVVPPMIGVVTPVLLLVLLGVWPYLDRNPAREPRKRVLALLLCVLVIAALMALTFLGWRE
jgi:ubiquinol-cytochrome c reductase cytochrome b subunit